MRLGIIQLEMESPREKALKRRIEELQDLAIWMTGCGYDFCNHNYFLEKRDLLVEHSDIPETEH